MASTPLPYCLPLTGQRTDLRGMSGVAGQKKRWWDDQLQRSKGHIVADKKKLDMRRKGCECDQLVIFAKVTSDRKADLPLATIGNKFHQQQDNCSPFWWNELRDVSCVRKGFEDLGTVRSFDFHTFTLSQSKWVSELALTMCKSPTFLCPFGRVGFQNGVFGDQHL